MIYTVGWLPSARDALTNLWLNASDRPAVSAASNAIDLKLKRVADRRGVPVIGGRRLLRVPPLAVMFTVDPGDCKATVLQVVRVRS